MKKLVLTGDEGTVAEKDKITFAVKRGFIYMDKTQGRHRIDWSGFHLKEAKLIRDFFVAGVKALQKQGTFANLTLPQARAAGRKAAKALPRI